MITLSDAARNALMKCFVTRGPHKGQLLAKPPKGWHTLAYAAWHSSMLHCNPYKASIAGLMLMSEAQLEVHREVLAWWEAQPRSAVHTDQDRAALELLGVW